MGRRKLVDDQHLFLRQGALKPGQSVPRQSADSNVHIVVLQGKIVITLVDEPTTAGAGVSIPVSFETPIDIVNNSENNSTFLISKPLTPRKIADVL